MCVNCMYVCVFLSVYMYICIYRLLVCCSSAHGLFTLFVADLGGLLGLFLGGSAISLFEIIDFFVYNLAVQVVLRKAKLNNKVENLTKDSDTISTIDSCTISEL